MGSMAARARRFWTYGQPFRERFGLLDGMRVAREIRFAEYRAPIGHLISVHVPGWSAPVRLRAGTSDALVFRQVLVARELEIDLEPSPVRILDGGMNFGLASLVFAHLWPQATIVGVELEAGNAEAAARNCASVGAISVRHAALWDCSGMVAVDNPTAEAYSYQASERAGHGAVRAYRVAELLDELGWDTVDLVKLDIEGAERRVLGDAPAWLPRVKHLLVELHDRFEPGCTAALSAALAGATWQVRQHGEYTLASRID